MMERISNTAHGGEVDQAVESRLEPIQAQERLFEIDALRGFAVLGILLVNMLSFASPWESILGANWWENPRDAGAETFITLFGMGKFLTLFSFLFGFGMVIIKERAEARGQRFVPLYLRRLLALLVFGALHALFIWYGDILFLYAQVGFALLLFHRVSAKVLYILGLVFVGLFMGMIMLFSLSAYVAYAFDLMPPLNSEAMAQLTIDTYAGGTFAEITQYRIDEFLSALGTNIMFMPETFGLFCLGAAVAKSRVFHDVGANLKFFRRVQIWSLAIALLLLAFFFGMESLVKGEVSLYFDTLDSVGVYTWSTFVFAFYASSLVLFMQRPLGQKLMRPFATAGRMAFTLYILQSVVFTTVFYGYGFGLYGEVGPFAGLMLTFAAYPVLLLIAHFWMKAFRYGPLEWIWRAVTYLQVPKMRRRNERA